MKKLFSKAKVVMSDLSSSTLSNTGSHRPNYSVASTSTVQASQISDPTPTEVIRYRYHHGTNLGSIFCLEKWLSSYMFPSDSDASWTELSAVKASIAHVGVIETKTKWENHWSSALSEVQLSWLVNSAHCTSIRLPIGYYCLGAEFCLETPFDEVRDVYVGAWDAIRTFVNRARRWGIGVLLDVHALPGGANSDAHGGSTSGKAGFWGSFHNINIATKAMMFIAQEIRNGLDGIIGLQIINEATWKAEGMFEWYDEVIEKLEEIDPTLPVYVSDAWNLGNCLTWASKRRGKIPVIVDTHKYYTFSESDRSQGPKEIISRIPQELRELDGREGSLINRGETQIVVGEYSCVLDGKTWAHVTSEERKGYVKQFGTAQNQKWQQRAGGAYFWTFKDGMGEWSFQEQTERGNIIAPASLLLSNTEVNRRSQNARDREQSLVKEALKAHEDYWSKKCPGQKFEHHRYSNGWEIGFSDAFSFYVMRAAGKLGGKAGEGGDKIGCVQVWVKKRLLDYQEKGPFVWEWEQGLRAGITAFNNAAAM